MTLLFESCDSPHYLYFINDSNSLAKVKIKVFPKTKNNVLKKVTTGDSIVYQINQRQEVEIYCGTGIWTEDAVGELVAEIKSIEIETENKRTIYKTQNEVDELLSNNRDGLIFPAEITIVIK
jgi:hypothetical protein